MNPILQRNFIIGDSWIYFKIYCGPNSADFVLSEVIKPVAAKLINEKVVDCWFFIRYVDPKNHLRVRFKFASVAPIIELIDEDLIWKVQTDTYQREIERYGVHTMKISESIFYHDSVMVADFIELIAGDEGEELRWLFSLRAMDSLLNSFHFNDEEKLSIMEILKTGFGNEFGMSRPLKKQLDDKFRTERKKIDAFMSDALFESENYHPIKDVLAKKELSMKPLVVEIFKLRSEEKLDQELDSLLSSYLHMLMNRIFKAKNRLHELVCYDFLYRYYKSMIARKKSAKKAAKFESITP